MARFFEQKNMEASLDELTNEMQKHLGEWISALFIAEGLTDELTSSCSPQEFYMLMPTLLNQSILAHECGKLTWDTLRSGFECM
jgi:mediator of RNA polymerase II transcription subunit 5